MLAIVTNDWVGSRLSIVHVDRLGLLSLFRFVALWGYMLRVEMDRGLLWWLLFILGCVHQIWLLGRHWRILICTWGVVLKDSLQLDIIMTWSNRFSFLLLFLEDLREIGRWLHLCGWALLVGKCVALVWNFTSMDDVFWLVQRAIVVGSLHCLYLLLQLVCWAWIHWRDLLIHNHDRLCFWPFSESKGALPCSDTIDLLLSAYTCKQALVTIAWIFCTLVTQSDSLSRSLHLGKVIWLKNCVDCRLRDLGSPFWCFVKVNESLIDSLLIFITCCFEDFRALDHDWRNVATWLVGRWSFNAACADGCTCQLRVALYASICWWLLSITAAVDSCLGVLVWFLRLRVYWVLAGVVDLTRASMNGFVLSRKRC